MAAQVQETGADSGAADLALLKGQVIFDKLDNKHYRILYLPPHDADGNRTGYWICTDSKSNIPQAFMPATLRQWLYATRCETAVDRYYALAPQKISDSAKRLRDRAYAAIAGLVTHEPEIYDRTLRVGLLQEAARSAGVTSNRIYTYLGKFWRGGMTADALLPDFAHIGTHRKHDFAPQRHLGRRPGVAGNNSKILTAEDFRIFKTVIEEYYKSDKKPKLRAVYATMLAHHYTRAVSKGDKAPAMLQAHEKPSYMQFYYWHKTHKDEVAEAGARLGENRFNLKARAIVGRSETNLPGPGMVYQIDATVADYYLVQSKDRNALVGRPVIFFIRDVRSRMIVGMYISLENASCNSAKMALKNCAEDKVAFCRRYGVEITADEWPCRHMPAVLIGDNGEMAGYGIEDVVGRLGIAIQNTPPYRGDLKAVIETVFNLINIKLEHLVPGHVEKDAGQRGAIDRRKEACVDLKTFTQIMIRTVLYYNNSWYMETYRKTPQMREHHVRPIPRELWNYGMQYESGALKMLEPDLIRRVLLSKSRATVTARGIRFNDLYYTCARADEEKWFSRARLSGRYPVEILYDPSCVENIYVSDGERELIECSLLPGAAAYANASEEDLNRYKAEDARERAAYAQEGEQARSELIVQVEAAVKRCKKAKNGESREAVAARLKGRSVRANRQAEKDDLSGKAEAQKQQDRTHAEGGQVPGAEKSAAEAGRQPDAVEQAIEDTLRAHGFLE